MVVSKEGFRKGFEDAEGFPELFELVKQAVRESLRRERSGLMVGLSSLGIGSQGFMGGYHALGSNAIVLNKTVLDRIKKARPQYLKPYAFSVLLHEYLHTLGVVNEGRARALTYLICRECFGEEHAATAMSKNFDRILPRILAPGPEEPGDWSVSVIEGIDEESMRYIG